MLNRCAHLGVMLAGAMGLLSIADLAHAAPPTNDNCGSAHALTLNTPRTGTTVEATLSFAPECTNDNEVWYTFAPPSDGSYRFMVTGASNAALSISALTNCGVPYSTIACATGSSGGAVIDMDAFIGDSVLVRVGSSTGQAITVTASVTPPPANDNCAGAGAIALTLNTPYSGNSSTATQTIDINNATACFSLVDGFTTAADVFFKFTPSTTGFYDIGTCGSEFDTVVSVHSACPVSAANMILCNDTGSLLGCGNFDSSAYLTGISMNAGVTYYIRLAGITQFDYTGRGNYQITVLEGEPRPVPANDTCATAEVLLPNNFAQGDSIKANSSTPGCGPQDAFDVWYEFTAPASSPTVYSFTVIGSSFSGEITMSAFDTCGGEQLVCQEFNSFLIPMSAGLVLALDPAQTVKIRIAGNNGNHDDFILQTSTLGAVGADTYCDNAPVITNNTPVNLSTGDSVSNEPSSCAGLPDIFSKWRKFTTGAAGYYRFSTDLPTGSQDFTTLTLYNACGGSELMCRTSGDALSTEENEASGIIQLGANQTVFIRSSIAGAVRGSFTLTANGPIPPPPAVPNDTCATAENIPSMPFTDTSDITIAGHDVPICVSPELDPVPSYSGVWYTYTATSNSYLVATAFCSQGERVGRATVFRNTCGSLVQVACPETLDGSLNPTPLTAGTTYRILVDIAEPFGGGSLALDYGTTIQVNMRVMTPPANDKCTTAQPITSNDTTLTFSNLLADNDTPKPSCHFHPMLQNGVWFKFTTGTAGTLTVRGDLADTENFHYSPAGALFTGPCASLTEVACDAPGSSGPLEYFYEFTTPLAAGQTYYLASGSAYNQRGGNTTVAFMYSGTIVPACRADFNNVNGVTVQDIFDFLTAWLAGNPSANFNGVNGVTVQDIFDFLTAWLAGC